MSFSSLPRELVDLCVGFIIDDDSEYVVLRQISKLFEIKRGYNHAEISKFVSRIPRLAWAKDNNYGWTGYASSEVCHFAAEAGNLEVLKWAKMNECSSDKITARSAAVNGHLEILKWVGWENNSSSDEWVFAYAAAGGHLDVLKWLKSQGCPWNSWACTLASGCGHLETLKWLRQNGSPWNQTQICKYVKDDAILNWLSRTDDDR